MTKIGQAAEAICEFFTATTEPDMSPSVTRSHVEQILRDTLRPTRVYVATMDDMGIAGGLTFQSRQDAANGIKAFPHMGYNAVKAYDVLEADE